MVGREERSPLILQTGGKKGCICDVHLKERLELDSLSGAAVTSSVFKGPLNRDAAHVVCFVLSLID